ncbi:pre-mRNA-splicing factor 38B [Stagonosporopsis vannaccii]|nr:pre-mRNA-splicing factor 38B [Stagonosporopsis vannaccii]
MSFDIGDDEYVARLLAQDARKTSKTYDLVGLDAFNPKRSRNGAPRPNTNFLRHIIRQTDNHNAALLAKEAEESSSRLRQMNRERDKDRTAAVDKAKRKIEGRLSPSRDSEDPRVQRSRRRADDGDGHSRKRDHRRPHGDGQYGSYSRSHRNRSQERHRHEEGHEGSDEDYASKSRHSRDHRESARRSRHDRDKNEDDKSHRRHQRKRRCYSRSMSRSRSRSPRRKSHRTRDRSRSPRHLSRSPNRSRRSRRQSDTPASDSDPLEAIVGPLPPPPKPSVRSRGRGALKASSLGIESRFAADYDPSMDLRLNSDREDDWDEALEAMRDRERWKQQGADRLRAAGFKDEQVKKWEKGGDPMEEDVVWTKKGQDREWDRGKVVDEDGDVGLKAEWGRLK